MQSTQEDYASASPGMVRGWHPLIQFRGRVYNWAGEYPSKEAAVSVSKQLLASAQKHGFVP